MKDVGSSEKEPGAEELVEYSWGDKGSKVSVKGNQAGFAEGVVRTREGVHVVDAPAEAVGPCPTLYHSLSRKGLRVVARDR